MFGLFLLYRRRERRREEERSRCLGKEKKTLLSESIYYVFVRKMCIFDAASTLKS
jgi:hypothetical protein